MPSLTYAEIATALRITPESANRLARRKRWPRVKGNDGKARVSVPEEALVRPDSPPASPMDSPPDNPVHAQLARLEGELAGVREALIEARARANAAEARSAELATDLDAERARTGRAIEALAALADRIDMLAAARRTWWRRLMRA